MELHKHCQVLAKAQGWPPSAMYEEVGIDAELGATLLSVFKLAKVHRHPEKICVYHSVS